MNVRLIAATNRDLSEEVRAGRMQADIYHRLSVYPLPVPPLRERGRDVLVLAGFFLEENRARLGLGAVRLDLGAQEALLQYEWPGNVRELEHLLSRSILRALGRQPQRPKILSLTADDLDLEAGQKSLADNIATTQSADTNEAEERVSLRHTVDALQRRLIEHAVSKHGGNWAGAARELQMDRANLARRLGFQP